MPPSPATEAIKRLEQRVVDLEVKLVYQERTIEDLDSVVRKYSEQVDRLRRELDLVRETIGNTQETGPANEKPPHY